MEYAIEIENVSVYYENICALSAISLKVENKDFLGIIGPNGGGKSTLLKVILGFLKPSTGIIRIWGQPLHKGSGVIGYVPQFSKFNKRFPINVRDVVLMGRLRKEKGLLRQYTAEDIKNIEELMKQLEIFDLSNKQIGQLSGGQLQRVLIARALAVQPRILLLDEPTASLDAHSKSQIYSILKELNKQITIVLVTHDMGVISSNVKNLACLNTRLHYHGTPELNNDIVSNTFGCPVDLIAHGVPHRVLKQHEG